MHGVRILLLAGAMLAATSLRCLGTGSQPARRLDPHADVTALFIGNSLTATNDLPRLVRRIAEAGGRRFDYAEQLAPGASLEDHWHAGAATVIAQAGARVVILQQGPSSLPESQTHLRTWAERFATPIRESGGVPVLLMVWPDASRLEAFEAVSASYRAAAEAVDGVLIPAGDAWRAVWARDPDIPLYGVDGFHPSPLGSLVAALTAYAVLFDADVTTLPDAAAPDVPREMLDLLLAAVAETVTAGSAVGPR